jgi:hypothetical protein
MQSHRRSFSALFSALILFVPCSNAAAQALTPGTRVRVKSAQVVAPIVGSYQGVRRDTVIVIEDGAGAKVWTFTGSAIDVLEVSDGMKGGNKGPTTRWALIGGGIGAALGALTAAMLESNSDSKYNAFASGAIGAAVGGGLGALYGSRQLEEHWKAVPIPRRVGLFPTRNGVGLSLSASF